MSPNQRLQIVSLNSKKKRRNFGVINKLKSIQNEEEIISHRAI